MTLLIPRMIKHAFLSGFVAAREIPAHEPCDGNKAWHEYEPRPEDAAKLDELMVAPALKLVRLSPTANVNPIHVESVTIQPRSFETGDECVVVSMNNGDKHQIGPQYRESIYQMFDTVIEKLTVVAT